MYATTVTTGDTVIEFKPGLNLITYYSAEYTIEKSEDNRQFFEVTEYFRK